jgi:O-antigen/teichoic acid export membrane protein
VSHDSGRFLVVNTVMSGLATAGGAVVGFLLTPFLIGHLGEHVYGLYTLAASVAAWSAVVGTPLGTYASRYATEHFERGEVESLNRTMATSFTLSLAAAAIVGLVVLLCAANARAWFGLPAGLEPAARTAIVIVGLAAAATIFIRVWEATVFVSRRFYLRSAAELIARIVGALCVVGWFLWVGTSLGVWLALIAGLPLVASAAVVVPLARRGLPVRLTGLALDRAELRRAVPFVGFIASTVVGILLFDNTDALVISKLPELGVSHLAAYDIGARWLTLVRRTLEAFGLALAPALVAMVARNDRDALAREVPARIRHILLLAMIPVVGLACVATPLVTHWVGESFVSRSVPVMWVTLASALVWTPGLYVMRLMIATSRLWPATLGLVVAGLINLLASIAFVRVGGMGLVGVAAGTLVATVLWSAFMIGQAANACGIPIGRCLSEALLRPLLTLPMLVLGGRAIVAAWVPRSLGESLGLLAALGSILAAVVLVVGLTGEERRSVFGRARRVVAWRPG